MKINIHAKLVEERTYDLQCTHAEYNALVAVLRYSLHRITKHGKEIGANKEVVKNMLDDLYGVNEKCRV